MDKGQRIKQLRESKGITQEELASLLQTTKQTISKYEKNIISNIPSDRIEELSKILDSTPSYILWGVDQKKRPKASMPKYDPVIIEIIDLLDKLTPWEKDMILYIMRLCADRNSGK